MEPCDKGPHLNRIELKIDSLFDAVTSIAVHDRRIVSLESSAIDHETRIRGIETAPFKRLEKVAWMVIGGMGGIGAAVLIAVIVRMIGNGKMT